MAIVVADLLALQREINIVGPKRDHGADGTYGDAAHRKISSDHNADDTPGVKTPFTDPDKIPEVHALDADSTGPWLPGWSMTRIVGIVIGRHRYGRMDVLQNVIYNRMIWSRSTGWATRPYTGDDPHTGHAHFSSRYGSGSGPSNPENYTGSWGIVDALRAEMKGDDMPTVADIWDAEMGKEGRRISAEVALVEAHTAAEAALAGVTRLEADFAELKALIIKNAAPK